VSFPVGSHITSIIYCLVRRLYASHYYLGAPIHYSATYIQVYDIMLYTLLIFVRRGGGRREKYFCFRLSSSSSAGSTVSLECARCVSFCLCSFYTLQASAAPICADIPSTHITGSAICNYDIIISRMCAAADL